MKQPNHKLVFYPPGGILLNLVIFVELFTYGLALFALAYYGNEERELFHQDSRELNRFLGTLNTLVLLTSGFLVAKGVKVFKQEKITETLKLFNWSMLLGLAFLVIKVIEYGAKLDAGFDLNYSSFFMFYWLLTGFHWIHVLVGVVILFFIRRSIRIKKEQAVLEDIEAGAAFWHMCDIIWLFLFPMLYLVL